MNPCPKCNRGMEWGSNVRNGNMVEYYWRCSWCGYVGEKIYEVKDET